MSIRIPTNSDRFYWTKHSLSKMQFYNLSESKIKSVLSRPDRTEDGIALKTMAVMQKTKSSKRPSEIWVMYQKIKLQIKVISAWRYPGISPVGGKVPIPLEILKDLGYKL